MSKRYALLSVSDKTGLVEVGQAIHQLGIEILSTGGSFKTLAEGGVPATQVSEFTGSPEVMDGRVKTLHPKIHGGILCRRNNPKDIIDLAEKLTSEPIDIVIVNLYPFRETVASGADEGACIENIDIGGPSLIRAGAKNFESVTVVVDPTDYHPLIAELEANNGQTTLAFRKKMARKAFSHTRDYDTAIADYFERDPADGIFPQTLRQTHDLQPRHLRYGENPHQQGAAYRIRGFNGITVLDAEVLADNKEISYNNFDDLDATLDLLLEFSDEPFACLLKHTNPCGAASGATLADAYRDALATDPLSAFGCIIGLNREVDLDSARPVHETDFVECILAPGYSPDALKLLRKKKQRRILALPGITKEWPKGQFMNRFIRGGLLRQQINDHFIEPAQLKVVTKRPPTEAELRSLIFAWGVVKQTKSNAIVIAKDTATVGIGMGDTSRVDSAFMAVKRAGDRAKGAVCASDAFFPKPDGVQTCTDAGVTAFIQPGGSKNDAEAIAMADAAGAAMVFTGFRCFKH